MNIATSGNLRYTHQKVQIKTMISEDKYNNKIAAHCEELNMCRME